MVERLSDFGLPIPRELAGETTAVVQALRSLPVEFADRVLGSLSPRRASAKRQAIAQRQTREGGRRA